MHLTRRNFLRGMIGIAVAGAFFDGMYLEPKQIEITKNEIPTEKVKDQFRIVHLTDLHLEKNQKRNNLVETVNALNPDVILMTGDYLNISEKEDIPIAELEDYVNKLKHKKGIYATFGNWDVGLEEKLFKNTRVKPLRNSLAQIYANGQKINIVGLDFVGGNKEILEKLDDSSYNILLSHSPDVIENIDHTKINLFLTGHTHGGQIRIPFVGGFRHGFNLEFPYLGAVYTISDLGNKYESGKFNVGNTFMYVNRGIGTQKIFPVRFFCKPEIAVFDLIPQ